METRTRSGLEELEEEEKVNSGIPTLCRSLDKLLGGGIKAGTLTEVVGLSGVGKTTLCLQLCLNVQIPICLQGIESEAIYIGTNHSLSQVRLTQMATEFVDRCNKIILKTFTKQPVVTIEKILSGIHVIKCCSIQELTRIILSLDKYLKTNDRVRLVVLDGIDFPMFIEPLSFSSRVKVLFNLVQTLQSYMFNYKLAIVITNSMTTRFAMKEESEIIEEYFVPYLGESLNYCPNQIIKLTCNPSQRTRKAELTKSGVCKLGTARYRIIHSGFRD
ncbi:DNA repair protein RAD51 homolog 3 [Folsomia candida]|uniref:DNA repair protein RAD51 homolog 3 n=1 Tax=Folsomia candida TaxID=158441 RepID=A0A226ELS0_FOLCA|nr:DNA repair protein RAD51 homolog 3 [Folsomia candida]OXA58087.1 hypothetical protein Fcan01_07727 [Folsomia candida]